MPLERYQDWPDILNDQVIKVQNREFCWGKFDCSLWACDVVEAMTGVDLAKPFRGRYKTKQGAYRVLKSYGNPELKLDNLKDVAEEIARKNHLVKIKPAFARRGDIVMVLTDDGPALGICLGHIAAFASKVGLDMVLMDNPKIKRGWRI